MSNLETLCEVCNKNKAIIVASSSWGAISHAYCTTCSEKGAEVLGTILSGIWCAGGWDEIQWKNVKDSTIVSCRNGSYITFAELKKIYFEEFLPKIEADLKKEEVA